MRDVLAFAAALTLLACCTDGTGAPIESATAAGGRQVIDTRDPRAFAAGHDPGALNLQWGWDQLEGRVAAYLPDPDTPIALRSESSERAAECAALLADAGYTDVVVLEDGPGDETLPLMTTDELARRLEAGDDLVVIDVRTPREWERGTIEGALLFQQDEAPQRIDGLDPEQEYAVICAGGFRSSQLASLLRGRGFERVTNVIDGMGGWYQREDR